MCNAVARDINLSEVFDMPYGVIFTRNKVH